MEDFYKASRLTNEGTFGMKIVEIEQTFRKILQFFYEKLENH